MQHCNWNGIEDMSANPICRACINSAVPVCPKLEYIDNLIRETTYSRGQQDTLPQGVNNQGTLPQGVNNQGTLPQDVNNQGTLPQDVNNQCTLPQGVNNQGTLPQGVNNQCMLPQDVNKSGYVTPGCQ